MRRARAVARAFALALLGPLVACHPSADKGAGVPGAPAQRVVSLSPSTTEALFAIGAGSALVGRSRYCDYPPEASTIPEVGGFVDPNLEAVLALKPDLVTGARGPGGPEVAERFGAHGIAVYFPETESLSEIDAMVRGLGARTDHVAGAEAAVAAMHAQEDAVKSAVAGRPRVRALLVFGIAPVVVAGPGGFPEEMLEAAGADNVVREGGRYPTLGLEHVMTLDPDVVIDAAMGEGHGASRISADAPGWRETRAVRSGHVVTLADEEVLRPGPRIGQGLRVLARALHPEAFEGHGG